MVDEIIVGIDLGTTFSAISCINQYGKPEIIPNREGDRTTPSVIFFDSDTPIVGKEARNQSIIDPRRTIRFIKREMGNSSFRVNIDGKDYFPEDLSALILIKLKNDAELYLNKKVSKAVISVPAYFKDAQREATKQAGKIAGLEVIRIINEPTAAALAYGYEKSEKFKSVLVFDFGGGTFDVTLMEVTGNEFEIVATDGDSKLGGKDIDGRLVEYFAEEFMREHDIDLRLEPHTHQDLWDKAEICKKDLSFRDNVAVALASGEKTLRIDIDTDTFLELIGDIIDQTKECVERTLSSVKYGWDKIEAILLAGGSSRIPAVKEMLMAISGKDVARDMNPDECVALGAAIQAVVTTIENEGVDSAPPLEGATDIIIKDVASHSLGVKALLPDLSGYVNSIIIPKLTPIPCEKTRRYSTKEDNQKKIQIEVLQGEDENPNSPGVNLVGKTGLSDLPPHKAGELVVEVTLSYNTDGVIEVTAKELMSGKTSREVVMKKTGLLSDSLLKEKQKALSEIKI